MAKKLQPGLSALIVGVDPSGDIYGIPLTAGGAAVITSDSGGGGDVVVTGPLGSQPSVASVSVVVASDQAPIPVTATVAPVYSHTVSSGPTQVAVGNSPTLLLAQNLSRTRFQVAQDGTSAILILYGSNNPSITKYNAGLAAGGFAHDQSVAVLDDTEWQGSVYAICSAGGGSVLVTEYE